MLLLLFIGVLLPGAKLKTSKLQQQQEHAHQHINTHTARTHANTR